MISLLKLVSEDEASDLLKALLKENWEEGKNTARGSIINKNNSQILNCYLDKKLFTLLLTNKNFNWNLAIGGSIILMERFPNKFIPDVPFSLNFLKC